MNKYTVEVELGNEAMCEPWQIAQALYALADSLVEYSNVSDIIYQA